MTQTGKTPTSNYALRLQTSMLNALKELSREENASINQLINTAVAEKLAVIGAEKYIMERAAQADTKKAWKLFKQIGKHNPPLEGDEL